MQHTLLSQDFPDDLNCFTYRASHWANEPTCLIKHGGSFQAWSCSDLIRKWLNWWKPSSVGTPQDTSTGSARMGGVQEPLSLKVFISSFIPLIKLCLCSCRRSFFLSYFSYFCLFFATFSPFSWTFYLFHFRKKSGAPLTSSLFIFVFQNTNASEKIVCRLQQDSNWDRLKGEHADHLTTSYGQLIPLLPCSHCMQPTAEYAMEYNNRRLDCVQW